MSQYADTASDGGILPQFRSTLLVAAGSNQISAAGSPTETLTQGIKALVRRGGVIRQVSRFFQTPCFPPGGGPDFVNAAFRFELAGDARAALDLLHEVEAELGRQRRQRWGPRTLDLDLIACGQQIRPDPDTVRRWIGLPPAEQSRIAPDRLILPHPRLQDRAFVLVPLMDIEPQWVHPLTGATLRRMHDALPKSERDAVKPLVNQARTQYTAGSE